MLLDRRQDVELRDAVSSLRQMLSVAKDASTAYQDTLKTACELTHSPYGFIAKREIIEGSLELRVSHLYCDTPEVLAIEATMYLPFPPQLKLKLCNGAQLISLQNLATLQGYFDGLDRLEQMIAIPISDAHSIHGVLFLANAESAYHTSISKRLWPLITNCICIARIIDQRKNNVSQITPLDSSTPNELYYLFEGVCPLCVITVDNQLNIIRINPRAEAIFGYRQNQAVGLPISTLLPERFINEHHTQTFAYNPLAAPQHTSSPMAGRSYNGTTINFDVNKLQYVHNGKRHHILIMRDTTEIEMARTQHEEEVERFRILADLAPVGILQTNSDWSGIYANDRWCEIAGRSMIDTLELGWLSAIHPDHFHDVIEPLRTAICEGKEFKRECLFLKPNNEQTWVELHARPQISSKGDITGFIATILDCTFRHEAEDKLRELAEHDPLTGLANRAMFQHRLEHGLSRTHRHGSLALLCLDLDGFKNVNDTLGHDCGDNLLIEVAKRLTRCVREEDTVARVGGDEFMILIEGLKDAQVAAEVSEKILTSLEPPCSINHQEVFISTSIGITFATKGDKNDSKSLMKQADMALYRAKHEGRNNFQYYSPDLERASQERLYLGNSLHHALQRTEFQVYYQFKCSLTTHEITGFEAVLRWEHPRRGQLQPDQFIPILDESGLIVPVSRWLTHTSFVQHAKWKARGLIAQDAKIAVNVSPRLLRDPYFIRGLGNSIQDARIDPTSVIIEITETALLEHSAQTTDALKELKKIGVAISLDDFGTGFSSLTHLKRYPIDQIKIDRSFVHNVLANSGDKAIVKAVIVLAKSLKLTVVAEGVEDRATLEYLASLNCDEYQGFYLNKPQPAEEIEKLLLSGLQLGPSQTNNSSE
ncbi:EAL domain-containing protein [Saccharophagus degradans]|uniref:sensor domain-containing protein n=1 Tax=Saccharophagus degradans TaxID=86304 RepID=UPI001C084A1C|nr:bifunctional diguanylate cyclase/phosphodiesterase [Saccharophagus degradans]MBU2985092.1 EAL domain-containing protein [Saccharophagus degradans]